MTITMPQKMTEKKTGQKTAQLIRKWVNPQVCGLQAYHVPSPRGMIKLDAMENPYQMPDEVRAQWLEVLNSVAINRYPDPGCAQLKATIRSTLAVPDNCGLMLGNGSDELIQAIAMLVGGPGRVFMAPTPTFSMYRQISLATATEFAGVPLNEDFSLQGDTLLGAIDRLQPACVFLAIPNNPTGNAFDSGIIEEVVQAAPGLVVIDEAYHAFCGKSWLDQIASHDNTLLLRTMSKSGLAGLRLGMLMAGTEWIDQLEKLRLPYNINALTQASVTFLLGHHHLMETQAQKIIDDRATLFKNLAAIEGVTAYPSETNFILFRLAQSAPDVFDGLVKRGVLVKNLHGSDPMLDNCLRVTVSSTSENTLFVEALASTLVAM